MARKMNADDLICHVLPLEKINDAFALMEKGKSIRSVEVSWLWAFSLEFMPSKFFTAGENKPPRTGRGPSRAASSHAFI